MPARAKKFTTSGRVWAINSSCQFYIDRPQYEDGSARIRVRELASAGHSANVEIATNTKNVSRLAISCQQTQSNKKGSFWDTLKGPSNERPRLFQFCDGLEVFSEDKCCGLHTLFPVVGLLATKLRSNVVPSPLDPKVQHRRPSLILVWPVKVNSHDLPLHHPRQFSLLSAYVRRLHGKFPLQVSLSLTHSTWKSSLSRQRCVSRVKHLAQVFHTLQRRGSDFVISLPPSISVNFVNTGPPNQEKLIFNSKELLQSRKRRGRKATCALKGIQKTRE